MVAVEDLQAGQVTAAGCQEQGRLPLARRARIDIGAVLEQRGQAVPASHVRRVVQRRPPRAVALVHREPHVEHPQEVPFVVAPLDEMVDVVAQHHPQPNRTGVVRQFVNKIKNK